MAHPGLAGSNALSTLGGTTRHHPHFDATLPHAAVRGEVAYRLRLCGNELDGWRRLTLRAGECGSFDALLEILEERLFLGVITNLAIEKEEPPEDEEEDPFEEITALADLPTAPAEAVLRVKSKCSGARKYPAVQPYHLHPYTLHDAATAGDTEALDELLEGGAKVGVAAGFGGRTAVHCASESGRAQAVTTLLEASAVAAAEAGGNPAAAVQATDVAGRTPLHLAARSGHIEVMLSLLGADFEQGAREHRAQARAAGASAAASAPAVHRRTAAGDTPLHEAARAGQEEALELLLRAGAEATCLDATRRSALHWTAAGGHVAAARKLLGAIPPAQLVGFVRAADQNGATALHVACGGGHAEMVRLLLERGADAQALDRVAISPAGWANQHRHPHLLPLLASGGQQLDPETASQFGTARPAGAATTFTPASFAQRHDLNWDKDVVTDEWPPFPYKADPEKTGVIAGAGGGPGFANPATGEES